MVGHINNLRSLKKLPVDSPYSAHKLHIRFCPKIPTGGVFT